MSFPVTRWAYQLSAIALLGVVTLPTVAQAERSLTIGMASVVTSLDPHEGANAPNNAASRHIYDSLVARGGGADVAPQLATSWKFVDDTHMRFTLREGVKFHDGSEFDSEDVVASLIRARDKPSQAFSSYTRMIKAVVAEGPYVVVVETVKPDPLILNSLSRIRIISSEFSDPNVAPFDTGEAVVGTGPFKLESYTPGETIKLKRNDDYYADPAEWDSVTLRMVPDDGGRLASLLSGDLDVIDFLPAEGIDRVKARDDLQILSVPSNRAIFLGLNVKDGGSPYITAKDGSPLPKNPLQDERVRKALLLAINREAIVERVMQGGAAVADQFVAEGFLGHSEKIEPVHYDPKQAKALLSEAGYPDGFKMKVHGPSGRYVNDSEVLQAVAQMFAQVGIDTEVEVMPWSVFSSRRFKDNFALYFASRGVNTGEVSNPAVAVVQRRDESKGTGHVNLGGVDVPEINELLDKAAVTLDESARKPLLERVSELTFNGYWILPLHYENVVMGAKANIDYVPRNDAYTLAYDIHSK